MRLTADTRPRSHSDSPLRTRPCAERAGGADRSHSHRSAPPHSPTAPTSGAHGRRRALALLICQLVLVALVLSASTAYGQPPPGQGPNDPNVADSVDVVLNNVRVWIMGILAALATVFLTVGGVRYVMASGDPGEVEKAKTCFKSAGWGYGLAALAPLVVEILKGIVGD